MILARLNAAFALALPPAPASATGTLPSVRKRHRIKASASVTGGLKLEDCKTVCEDLRFFAHPQNKYMRVYICLPVLWLAEKWNHYFAV